MAKQKAKDLTDRTLKTLKPGNIRREIPDGHTRGLFLVVQPTGKMSWAVRYRFKGVPRKHTLGTYPNVDMKTARELASAALLNVAKGVDPSAAKQADRHAAREKALAGKDEVSTVCRDFVERHAKKETRESSWRETERLLNKHVVAAWKGKLLRDIERKKHVLPLLDSILDDGKPILANRVHGALRVMCNWAVKRGIIDLSPCMNVDAPAKEASRERALEDGELKEVWKACDTAGVFGPLVRLLVLTGQRREEVGGMRWGEVDLEARLWTLPPQRSKNGTEHVIPLSEQAAEILGALLRLNSKARLIFTTTGETSLSGFSRMKERLDAFILAERRKGNDKAEAPPHWTLHDLRRTAASGMAKLGMPVHVVEAVLNHRSGTIRGVARVYNRYNYLPEKRQALEAWGRKVEALVSGKPADNVVELAMARG